ncbi:MAG: hypothetical protein QXU08_05795 [Ignisphaera sp.]
MVKKNQEFRVVYDSNLSDDVYSYMPMNCFFIDEDPLKIRLAFVLVSILYTLYSKIPKSLEYVISYLNYQPVKYDLENPIDIGYIMYIRSVLRFFCLPCPDNRWCPWISAIRSLRIS